MVDKEVLSGFHKKAETASDEELCAIEAGLRAYRMRLHSATQAYADATKALGIILEEKLARLEVRQVTQRRKKKGQR